MEIVFAYTYPRLDVEVSKKRNHLLKAPFCVHPKTGKICVPIDPRTAWDFDIDTVPTVSQLVEELSSSNQDAPAQKVGSARVSQLHCHRQRLAAILTLSWHLWDLLGRGVACDVFVQRRGALHIHVSVRTGFRAAREPRNESEGGENCAVARLVALIRR